MLVIAGKNNIAVYALYQSVNFLGKDNVCIVCNKTETGVATWQLSLREEARKIGVEELTIEEVYCLDKAVFISLEFDQIIKTEKFTSSELFNIHFSKLPAYKGMYTAVWPILNGEINTAVTLHKIDNGIDTGDIVDQLEFSINPDNTSKDLYLNYIKYACILFDRSFHRLMNGSIKSLSQKSKLSSYYSKDSIDYSSLEVNFYQTAWQIQSYVRAFSFRNYQLIELLSHRVVKVEILEEKSVAKPGTCIDKNEVFALYSTVDYDVKLYFDKADLAADLCTLGEIEGLRNILQNITCIDDRVKNEWTLLMIAAFYGHYSIAKFLIENGADVNAVNPKFTSVLMYSKDYALTHGDKKVFDLLVKHGANISHKDIFGCDIKWYTNNTQQYFLGL